MSERKEVKSFTLSKEIIKRIRDEAEKKDRSESYIVNKILDENLEEGEK